jgi:hypothetical protein
VQVRKSKVQIFREAASILEQEQADFACVALNRATPGEWAGDVKPSPSRKLFIEMHNNGVPGVFFGQNNKINLNRRIKFLLEAALCMEAQGFV